MISPRSLLRLEVVLGRAGQSRAGLYRQIQAGTFPRPIIMPGTTIRCWDSAELEAAIAKIVATAPREETLP